MWCLFFYCYLMAASKELCSVCAKPFNWKQKTIHGIACDLHFHCLVHKLVTWNRCFSPLSGNNLFSVKPVPSSCNQHEMTTHQLGLSGHYLHLMLHIPSLMEVKSNSTDRELHLSELSTIEFLSVI
jgi:hypothetical protein